ncbi:MAG: hypothetical protein IPO93_18525 [Actinobacteria bacterium]|nr:hypothetical protein [Actinomycetota bacterium]
MRAVGVVAKSVDSRGLLATLAVLLVAAGTLFGASVASADSVQVQSYQRASQSEACVAQPGETAWQASWGTDPSWHASWDQWANNGKGGWTCTRTIVWAKTPVAAAAGSSSSVTYRVGDIGPGGGLIFLIDSGLRYEMAPSTWVAGDSSRLTWCDSVPVDVPLAIGTAVGTGAANTAAMAASVECSSDAAAAVLAYPATDSSAGEWFLPSWSELNAMCNYSRSPSSPAPPSVDCSGAQDGTFAGSDFGFTVGSYWSSTQANDWDAWLISLSSGSTGSRNKNIDNPPWRVRPIRTF